MRVLVTQDEDELARAAADVIGEVLIERPDALLIAPTGTTPLATYHELARRRADGRIDTSGLRVAQLDEYLGVGPDEEHSLFGWMKRTVLDPLGVTPERTIRFRADADDPAEAIRAYDRAIDAAGGVDLAMLGIGTNGHVGFNEPPSPAEAPTRVVTLTAESRAANARYWSGAEVPTRAITAGMRTLLASRRILVLASGSRKAGIVDRMLHSDPTADVPASLLRDHPRAELIVDRAAAPPQT